MRLVDVVSCFQAHASALYSGSDAAMTTPTMAAVTGGSDTNTANTATSAPAGPSKNSVVGGVRQRLQQEFGKQMSEKTLQDLLELASYRMLGAAPGGQQKHFTRSTTLVLAQRPRRAAALRCETVYWWSLSHMVVLL